MAIKASDLPTPILFYEGKLRNWWRFGDGENAIAVTEGPSSKGHFFRCDCNPISASCAHIRKLEQHTGLTDYRNESVHHASIREERVA